MKKNENLAGYLAEMRKANCLGDDFWRKEAGQIVQLTNGGYFVVKKSRIETNFCFGYQTDFSGHEHSDAEEARQRFLSSSNAFKNRNLSKLDGIISSLKRENEGEYIVLRQVRYYGQTEPINVYEIDILKEWQMINKYGEGNSISYQKIAEVCISKADLAIVLSAYEAERESLNKRLDTYLKKYGTKHLRTWTYWRDE